MLVRLEKEERSGLVRLVLGPLGSDGQALLDLACVLANLEEPRRAVLFASPS